MKNPSIEAGIPVLTEVIPQRPPEAAADIPPAHPVASQMTNAKAPPLPRPERRMADWNEEHWLCLEREVRERVLNQVLERIDFVLEQRVRDSLADVLQIAVEGLAADIKSGLHQTVKDVVTRAVMQEIAKLQSTKK